MKIFPKFPKVGKIPTYAPTNESALCTIIIAGLLVCFYSIYGNWGITTFSLAVITLKFWLTKRSVTLNKYIPFFLLIIAIGLIVILFGGYGGRQASLSLLTLLLGLKILESKDTRGYSIACLLMYFLSAVIFAYESSSAAIITLIVCCLLITSCLAMLSQPTIHLHTNNQKYKEAKTVIKKYSWLINTVKENSKILFKALPLTILLFFLFPRIQGNFGFLPGDDTGKPQLENEMSAGDFSLNAFSNELAFRVEFSGQKPKNNQLYWRSKVFDLESQFTWTRGELSAYKKVNITHNIKTSELIEYNIIHQATDDIKLPTLETMLSSSKGLLLGNYTLLNRKRGTGAFEYEATSSLAAPNNRIARNSSRYLQTSFPPGEKITSLINGWQQKSTSIESFVNHVLQHFNQNPFKYDLRSPSLNSKNPVEEFLFETQSGYCEHYASAFTLLMRWAGIPSRVVVGYQGGEWIEEGNFLEVRYSDAHAWSEVWIDGQGWKRVDPTFAIAPERIEFGMDALFALWENNQIGTGITSTKLADMLRARGINQTWRKLSKLSRSYGHRWDKWVVNFNHERQLEILKKLKLEGGNTIAKLLGLMFFGCLLVIGLFLYRLLPKKTPLPLVDQYYQEFLKKLAKKNITLNDAEGPSDFAKRASESFPDNKADIHKITQYYINLKYNYRSFNLNRFKVVVKHFNL